jgi:ribosome recycling factor
MTDYKAQAETAMKARVAKLKDELSALRTGRASPGLLEAIKVEYYGQLVPIKQVAAITVPDARTLEVRPWDPSAAAGIQKAIENSDIGVRPQGDDKVIRLSFPPMTEERRKEMAKVAGKVGEEYRVSIRGDRRDTLDQLKAEAKKTHLPEDQQKLTETAVQKLTDAYIKQVDEVVEAKQKEILTF